MARARMDYEKEIHRLHAQALATRMIIANVLSRALWSGDARVREIIIEGFDGAANSVEHIAIALGEALSPKFTVDALETVEKLRFVVVGDECHRKHGV